jgi:hypothetical protein
VTLDVAAHLLDLERALMQPEVRRSAERLRALIRDDFLEIGASGRTYALDDLIAQLLSPDIALVTYRTDLKGIARLRSSIWRCVDGAWRLHFHQGTPTP